MGQKNSKQPITSPLIIKQKKPLVNFYGLIVDPNAVEAVTKEYSYINPPDAPVRSGLLVYLKDSTQIFLDINNFNKNNIPPKSLQSMFDSFWRLIRLGRE